MMKKMAVLVLCAGVMVGFIGPAGLTAAHAGAKVVKIEGAQFSVARSMAENITAFKGKMVTVTLATGESISGKVVDVNSRYVHLTELERATFLDALIDLNHVSAVKAQMRKYEND